MAARSDVSWCTPFKQASDRCERSQRKIVIIVKTKTYHERSVSTRRAVLNSVWPLLMLLQTFGSVAFAQDAAGPGEAPFSRVCGQCDGPAGEGAVAPALVPMDRALPELLDVIREGRGMMPPLSPTTISD